MADRGALAECASAAAKAWNDLAGVRESFDSLPSWARFLARSQARAVLTAARERIAEPALAAALTEIIEEPWQPFGAPDLNKTLPYGSRKGSA